ncbi:hypothetical protein IQ238_24860 [Pleurocapsales cyanobacterium LEGE 06147]|nr:hypothetical protein [Pleurocapsales cyanobacterium LEGE 06147]
MDEAKQGYDLAILGASERWFLHQWLFGALSGAAAPAKRDRVAEEAPCSVLLVRKHEPRSVLWIERIIARLRGL